MKKYPLVLISLVILTLGIVCRVVALDQHSCESDGQFTWVPKGSFWLGSDQKERDYGYRLSAEFYANPVNNAIKSNEQVKIEEQALRQAGWFDTEPPRQLLTLAGFCISRYLVTNAEYFQFVRATGYPIPGITAAEYQKQGFLVHPYTTVQPFLWSKGKYPKKEDNHPVVLISYTDALAYTKWRQKQDKFRYRLPTAPEWEKAARGTDGRYFPWGNTWHDQATNWAGTGLQHTSPRNAFPIGRSPYGLEDTTGNVFEYTATLQANQTRVVMKGCAWDDSPGFCRVAYQHTRPIESRHILFGFRLVRY